MRVDNCVLFLNISTFDTPTSRYQSSHARLTAVLQRYPIPYIIKNLAKSGISSSQEVSVLRKVALSVALLHSIHDASMSIVGFETYVPPTLEH